MWLITVLYQKWIGFSSPLILLSIFPQSSEMNRFLKVCAVDGLKAIDFFLFIPDRSRNCFFIWGE